MTYYSSAPALLYASDKGSRLILLMPCQFTALASLAQRGVLGLLLSGGLRPQQLLHVRMLPIEHLIACLHSLCMRRQACNPADPP